MKVDPQSSRLQLLEPFKPWNGKDLEVVLLARQSHPSWCKCGQPSPAQQLIDVTKHVPL